jgi:hypothetical protein
VTAAIRRHTSIDRDTALWRNTPLTRRDGMVADAEDRVAAEEREDANKK